MSKTHLKVSPDFNGQIKVAENFRNVMEKITLATDITLPLGQKVERTGY